MNRTPNLYSCQVTPFVQENQHDDISDSLTPEQRLWAVLHQATLGEYRDFIPQWWWRLYGGDCPNMDVLKCNFERYINQASNAATP